MQISLSSALVAAAIVATGSHAAELSSSHSDTVMSARTFWGNWNSWNPWSWMGSYSDSLASKKCYGAPQTPWTHGSSAGWYIGDSNNCGNLPKWDGGDQHWCNDWRYRKSGYCSNGNPAGQYPWTDKFCWGLQGGVWGWPKPKYGSNPTNPVPQPPTGQPAPICDDGYKQVFSNYTTTPDSGVYAGQVVGAATIDNDHYLTYGLADTVDECLQACDQVANCAFVNVYHDHLPEGDLASMPKYASGKYTCAFYSACSGREAATNYGGIQDPSYITDSSGWCKSDAC